MLRSAVAVLALFAGVATVQAGPVYQATSTAMSWHAAEAEAVSLGGHLVSIHSQAEQDDVYAYLSQMPAIKANKGGMFWIGYYNFSGITGGEYAWSDESPGAFENWQPSVVDQLQPTAPFIGIDPVDPVPNPLAAAMSVSTGYWFERNATNAEVSLYYGIIALDDNSVRDTPEPASLALLGLGGALALVLRQRQKRHTPNAAAVTLIGSGATA